jgi:hypothetical protein
MGGYGIEVQIQPIAGEDREVARSQALMELVHDTMRCVLCPGAKLQDRDQFGKRVDRHPQPQDMGSIAQPRPEFVKLEMRQREVPKPAVMQGRAVLACTCEPGAHGAFTVPKDPHSGGERETFSQGCQDFCDP